MGLCCYLRYLPSWYTIKVFLTVNAIVGLLIFLRAWTLTKKMRVVDKERDALFHSTTRYDAQRWHFWAMLPLAVTVMPIRLGLQFFFLFASGLMTT